MLWLAKSGDVPPEANQTAGQEAITLARTALEIRTQLHGLEHIDVAHVMRLLADSLEYFNNVDDVEVLHLYERALAIFSRVQSSFNVAASENNLAAAYRASAKRARDASDLDREMKNLELTLSHYSEAVRIYSAIDHVDSADRVAQRCLLYTSPSPRDS